MHSEFAQVNQSSMARARIAIRAAVKRDVAAIKQIADLHRAQLGFITRPVIAEAVIERRVFVAVSEGRIVAFVHFRHRRDGATKIYQICVADGYRRRSCGRFLLQRVKVEAKRLGQSLLTLKCPQELPANLFYLAIGGNCLGLVPGRKRPLLVWEFSVGRSTR